MRFATYETTTVPGGTTTHHGSTTGHNSTTRPGDEGIGAIRNRVVEGIEFAPVAPARPRPRTRRRAG